MLANPGMSYIIYTYDCSGPLGLKQLTAGTYELLWFDTITGRIVKQLGVPVAAGDAPGPSHSHWVPKSPCMFGAGMMTIPNTTP